MQTHDPSLACLDQFFRAVMPAAVRKLRCWQGLSAHSDLIADLAQEVAADFVAHRATVEAMPRAERHERWLRLIGRSHYRLRGRETHRVDGSSDLDALAAAAPPAGPCPVLDRGNAAFAEQVLEHGVHLKNGRLNEVITARSIGLTPQQFRRCGARLVAALQDARDIDFWRRRLVEALLGLAADVLRDRGHVVILADRRSRPDPAARLRRVLRIRQHLRYLPVCTTLRRVLLRYGSRCPDPFDPARALDSALELAPGSPQAHLWSFELAVAQTDARRAARALRHARRSAADPTAVVLARARLLELRGRELAAGALLRRARRRRDDSRLRLCLDRVCRPVKASG